MIPRLSRFFSLIALTLATPLVAQQVALTFDDLPAHGPLPPGVTREAVITDILAALKRSGTPPVYGFINGVRTQEVPADAEVLRLWRRAGYPLGNHTWTHMNLNDHTAAEWEADVLKNEPLLEAEMKGHDWHWLRFPYLAEGSTPATIDATRSFLAAHGYRIAGVTASFGDYLWNEPYARCLQTGDAGAVAQLEATYLQAAREDFLDRRAMAKAALGHDIPYVLLMHVGAFDAHMLPRLLAQYRQDGVTFVSLQQAEADPFYRNDLNPKLPHQPDTLEAALAQAHRSIPRHTPPTAGLDRLCR